ncbi:3,4-dihydroxy-2-butanone-4-phosphate synthase [Salinisphaera hydrothermalis]|uniref:3,4-dihydroxy-2-butanone 4-phosphate synthase n=1 Tax=Salinisphaera hydrothermalis (strain C41B8) TaxID=1304275 RepID=A0A084IR48_SALHC|nr:3,4-dihydroxy-2-butanone-4-phosphate synthase [Salinisphaera hydrothermalis]KEZ79182.1 3,4-dihydroxy-2-butanone 4-phosphate synthase [Salinisphaera hydrothermalis C41B8]
MSASTEFQGFPRLAAAIQAYRAGRPVLLLDDSDRENEADIVAAAENLSVDTMVKMIRDGSGIVCLCFRGAEIDKLGLPQMVNNNQSKNRTGFTVSIEAATGVTTGVSAADRVRTIAASLEALDGDHDAIVSPGHVFPLRAVDDGVLARRGHTEGSLDLAILAGMRPAAVLCELMNDDGTMAGNAEIEAYAARHDMPVLTIDEIARYRESRLAHATECA